MNGVDDKLKDIFRELRNQHVLPVVAVLIVAIFAVPMALKAGGTEPAPTTELAAGLKPMLETEPVVLTATPELRDFRTRLDESSKKNPFHQPTPVRTPSADAGGDGSASADATDTSAPATGGDTGTIPADIQVPSSDGSTVPSDSGGSSDSGDSGDSSDSGGSSDDTGGVEQVISYDIDVEIGKVGKEKTIEGVESTTLLPNPKSPLLQFVNTDLQGTYAVFIVSTDVVRADGDGNCSPTRTDCQYLKLQVGDAERLSYQVDGDLYRIKLLAITRQIDVLEKVLSAADDVAGPIESATQWKAG